MGTHVGAWRTGYVNFHEFLIMGSWTLPFGETLGGRSSVPIFPSRLAQVLSCGWNPGGIIDGLGYCLV